MILVSVRKLDCNNAEMKLAEQLRDCCSGLRDQGGIDGGGSKK